MSENGISDRERALAVAVVGQLLTYLSAPQDHGRMPTVFGFILTFCLKAPLEYRLNEEEIELLWQNAAQTVRHDDWLFMLHKMEGGLLGLEMKFGTAIEAAKRERRAHWVKEPGGN